MAAGLTPVDSVSQPIQAYAGKVLDSQAKVDLVNNLKALPNPPVMDMPPVGARLPDGFVPGAAIAPQFQGVAFTKPVAESLQNILGSGLGDAPVVGGVMRATGLLKENLFLGSGFHGVQELKQAAFANPGLLGVIPVKGIKAAAQATWGTVIPGAADTFRTANADTFDFWANQGVTGLAKGGNRGADIEGAMQTALKAAPLRSVLGGASGASLGYAEGKKQGLNDGDLLKRTLLGGVGGAVLSATLGPQITKGIFEREIPMLKVLTAENLRAAGNDPQAIATFVNTTFGGQNLAAIARSRVTQDVLRLGALSPDWWEGWARQIGRGAQGFVGQGGDLGKLSRGYWLRNATIQGAFGLEGLNYAFNGHLTNGNEPGHALDLEITGVVGPNAAGQRRYVDILGPIRPLAQLAMSGNIGQFAGTRASLPVSLALQDIPNKDYAGQPVVPPGTKPWKALGEYAINAGQRVAPIGLQQLTQTAMTDQNAPDLSQAPTAGKTAGETAFTMATGMRTSAGPAPQALYDQRDNIVQDVLPKWQDQLRNSEPFQKATPDERTRMLAQATTDVTNDVNNQLGLPLKAKDLGLPPKYYGVKDPKQTMAIDKAVGAYTAWQRDPKNVVRPSAAELKLAYRYQGEETTAYKKALQKQQQAGDKLKTAIAADVQGLPQFTAPKAA
jgi:hypothetical protein